MTLKKNAWRLSAYFGENLLKTNSPGCFPIRLVDNFGPMSKLKINHVIIIGDFNGYRYIINDNRQWL